MRRNPPPAKPDPRQPWQIEQAARCGCKGSDDLCPCQNENPWPRPAEPDWKARAQAAEARILSLEAEVAELEGEWRWTIPPVQMIDAQLLHAQKALEEIDVEEAADNISAARQNLRSLEAEVKRTRDALLVVRPVLCAHADWSPAGDDTCGLRAVLPAIDAALQPQEGNLLCPDCVGSGRFDCEDERRSGVCPRCDGSGRATLQPQEGKAP